MFRDQIAVELGHPNKVSSNMVLWTYSPEMFYADSIRLLGPDLPETIGNSIHYAQIIILKLEEGSEIKPFAFQRAQYLHNQIPGLSMRVMPGRIWCQVSHTAIKNGLCFSQLGECLIRKYRMIFKNVEHTQITFITLGVELVKKIKEISYEVHQNLYREEETSKRNSSCKEISCEVCDDRMICNRFRRKL